MKIGSGISMRMILVYLESSQLLILKKQARWVGRVVVYVDNTSQAAFFSIKTDMASMDIRALDGSLCFTGKSFFYTAN